MRDNNFDRAQAAYDAMLPDDYDDVPMTCPECDGDTDNGDEDGPLPCDDCTDSERETCDGCGCGVHADEMQEWPHYAQGKPWGMLCADCWRRVAPSPAEDGRW